MTEILLEVRNLNKSFDGVNALSRFSCDLKKCEVLGLIGPNGAGKTTLFNVITGFLTPDSGTVAYKGFYLTNLTPYRIARRGLTRTFQDLRLVRQLSVLDNVLFSFTGQPGERLRNVFFGRKKSKGYEAKNRVQAVSLLQQAGLAEKVNEPAENISYGEQKLLSLACCLAAKADLLLLDEPVAGIAPEMTEKILSIIRELPSKDKSVIIIEHNLDAVMQVCDRVVFMDAGTKVSEGRPEEVRNDPKVIEAYID